MPTVMLALVVLAFLLNIIASGADPEARGILLSLGAISNLAVWILLLVLSFKVRRILDEYYNAREDGRPHLRSIDLFLYHPLSAIQDEPIPCARAFGCGRPARRNTDRSVLTGVGGNQTAGAIPHSTSAPIVSLEITARIYPGGVDLVGVLGVSPK